MLSSPQSLPLPKNRNNKGRNPYQSMCVYDEDSPILLYCILLYARDLLNFPLPHVLIEGRDRGKYVAETRNNIHITVAAPALLLLNTGSRPEQGEQGRGD